MLTVRNVQSAALKVAVVWIVSSCSRQPTRVENSLSSPPVYTGVCSCDPKNNMPSTVTVDGGSVYGENPGCPPMKDYAGIPQNASCCESAGGGVFGCGMSPCADCNTYGLTNSVCDTDPSAPVVSGS